MKRIVKMIALVALALVTGCAGLTGGRFYDYHYTTKADGTKDCHLIIDSGSVSSGATLDICGVDGKAMAGAATMQQGESRIDLNGLTATVGAVVQQAIRGQPITVPPPAPAQAPPDPAKQQ